MAEIASTGGPARRTFQRRRKTARSRAPVHRRSIIRTCACSAVTFRAWQDRSKAASPRCRRRSSVSLPVQSKSAPLPRLAALRDQVVIHDTEAA
jgi:hypothetical protein